MVKVPRPLASQEASNAISLYFHLPFCTNKCAYCHFYVLPDKDPLKAQLMEGLELEWQHAAPLLQGKKVHTIYFGGGTPWLMGADKIATILRWIKQTLPFTTDTPEITLEANPENVNSEHMRAYAEAGINRISIGIQSLDPELLKVLDRQHSGAKAMEAVYIAKECNITNISVDLMYDLPQQTLKAWESTLEQARKLPITHLSLYNLTFEPHTVFYKQRDHLLKQVPDENISLQMYETAVDMLESAGLQQYEISAFARDGNISQHNTGYWSARPFLGFGPSAFSDWEGARFQNVANLSRYVKALREGVSPVDFREQLDLPARRRELLTIQIRMLEGVDVDVFQKQHGPLESETLEAIQQLCDSGYLQRGGQRVQLTRKGILFYDSVATDLI